MISAVASFQRAGQKEEEMGDLLSHLSLEELRAIDGTIRARLALSAVAAGSRDLAPCWRSS